jgi:aspartate dehydrogenase
MVDGSATQPRLLRIAVVGAGAIGRQLVLGVSRGDAGAARVVAIADVPERRNALEALGSEVAGGAPPALVTDARGVTAASPDVVVEAAGPAVVRDHAEHWLAAGADVLVMSVGALADANLLARLETAARVAGRSVLVPSGAIGGLDAVRAARLAGLDSVELRTTKAPRSLAGAPGIVSAGIDLDVITGPTVVFEGNALDAVSAFPANLNVVAALSLAGLGPERTRVVLVADPAETRNVHEIRASGAFGELTLRFANLPSAENPKTSALAPYAALALLRRRAEAIQVGS